MPRASPRCWSGCASSPPPTRSASGWPGGPGSIPSSSPRGASRPRPSSTRRRAGARSSSTGARTTRWPRPRRLAAAGIGAGTADPPGGVIERGADGEPTGFLVERPAAELVERAMPVPTLEDRLRWLAAIQPRFLAAGITGVVDPALEAAELIAYATAAERGELALRVTGMPLGDGEVPPAERAAAFTRGGGRPRGARRSAGGSARGSSSSTAAARSAPLSYMSPGRGPTTTSATRPPRPRG